MPVNISGELDENGREIINRRAGEFPAIICNDDLTFDPVPWHWHDELEINVVKKGKILFKAGKKKFSFRKEKDILSMEEFSTQEREETGQKRIRVFSGQWFSIRSWWEEPWTVFSGRNICCRF